MDFETILGIILPIIYIIVGAALVWFIVELVLTVRRTRSTVDSVQKQIEPTIAHVNAITQSLEPVASKIDPLMDRVSLTVDAANLEIMRVDTILEDVQQMTGTVTKTLDTVDSVTSLPLDAVNSVTTKLRGIFKKPEASEQSLALGKEKGKEDAESRSNDDKGSDTPLDRHIEAASDQMKQVQADVDDVKESIAYIKADEPDQN